MIKTVIFIILFVSFFGAVQGQKGAISISAGPLVTFPPEDYGPYRYATGFGLETIGQYNFTNKSALLLQIQFTHFRVRIYDFTDSTYTSLSIKGGYRYQFTNSGFYANVLTGIETGWEGYNISPALGAGKRFTIKDVYFIDAGVDLISGSPSRLNIKAVSSLLQRPKNNKLRDNNVLTQKGEKSISVGPLVSFPQREGYYGYQKTSVGLEAIGQYNVTNKSGLLLQVQFTQVRMDKEFTRYRQYTSLSLKGGYRYQFTNSGFYTNVLGGVEKDRDGYMAMSAALGAGKRFPVKNGYFIDSGIDYIVGSPSRLNIKAVFSLLLRPKKQ